MRWRRRSTRACHRHDPRQRRVRVDAMEPRPAPSRTARRYRFFAVRLIGLRSPWSPNPAFTAVRAFVALSVRCERPTSSDSLNRPLVARFTYRASAPVLTSSRFCVDRLAMSSPELCCRGAMAPHNPPHKKTDVTLAATGGITASRGQPRVTSVLPCAPRVAARLSDACLALPRRPSASPAPRRRSHRDAQPRPPAC
jgi:hypothetical protein